VGVLCTALAACGGPLRYAPKGTPKAPDADASIVADLNKGSSLTRLTVKVEHLAPPDRLKPDATNYVVWARHNDGSPWQRIGGLAYDADARKGELVEASVPLLEFELIISIEKQPAPATPSEDVVISQKVED